MSFTSWFDARIAKVREDAINQLLKPENLKKVADVVVGEVSQLLDVQTSELVDHIGKQTTEIVDEVGKQTTEIIDEVGKVGNGLLSKVAELLGNFKLPTVPGLPDIFPWAHL